MKAAVILEALLALTNARRVLDMMKKATPMQQLNAGTECHQAAYRLRKALETELPDITITQDTPS